MLILNSNILQYSWMFNNIRIGMLLFDRWETGIQFCSSRVSSKRWFIFWKRENLALGCCMHHNEWWLEAVYPGRTIIFDLSHHSNPEDRTRFTFLPLQTPKTWLALLISVKLPTLQIIWMQNVSHKMKKILCIFRRSSKIEKKTHLYHQDTGDF